MRKRSKEVIFRMTPDENCLFERKVEESGLTKQKYLLALALDKKISTGKELAALTELNQNMSTQISVINQVLDNLKDISFHSVVFGELRNEEELNLLIEDLKLYKKEGMEQWELLRLFNAAQSQMLD